MRHGAFSAYGFPVVLLGSLEEFSLTDAQIRVQPQAEHISTACSLSRSPMFFFTILDLLTPLPFKCFSSTHWEHRLSPSWDISQKLPRYCLLVGGWHQGLTEGPVIQCLTPCFTLFQFSSCLLRDDCFFDSHSFRVVHCKLKFLAMNCELLQKGTGSSLGNVL